MRAKYILFTFGLSAIFCNLQAQTWQPIGTGLNGASKCLTVDTANNKLLVGGDFTMSNGILSPFISSFNGTVFEAIGNGFNNTVKDVEIYQGEPYACGYFTMSGTDTVKYLSKWNGTDWVPLIDHISGGGIEDMIEYQGSLYVCGSFDSINHTYSKGLAKWNGTSFSSSGVYLDWIYAMEKDDIGNLLFSYWGPPGTGMRIGKYNGFTYTAYTYSQYFYAFELKFLNGILYFGGPDYPSGPMQYFYSFDGSAISTTNYMPSNVSTAIFYTVSCIGERNGHLVVGMLPITAGVDDAILWEESGGDFHVLGYSNTRFDDVAEMDHVFYTVGSFNHVAGVAANNIARLVTPPPIANFNATGNHTCTGNTVSFHNTTTNGPASYYWSFPGGSPGSSIFANPTVTYNTPGSYDVTLISSNVYGTDTIVLSNYVVITPQPAQPIITLVYPNLVSSYSSNNQWYLNGTIIAGATNQIYTPLTNGSYTVKYTPSSGCTSLSDPFVLSSAGTEDILKDNFEIITSNNVITISNQLNADPFELMMTDMKGSVLYTATSETHNIDMNVFTPGIYVFSIYYNDRSYVFKKMNSN